MLGRLNHVAIAVKDAEKAARIYGGCLRRGDLGAVPLPDHGVITVFVTLPNTKIEFIQPLGEASPDRQVPRAQCRRRHPPHLLRSRRHHRLARYAGQGGRAGARRRRAEDRRPRQAGAVLPPEGFFRRAGRNRTELEPCGTGKTWPTPISTALAIYFVVWWIVLFLTLPFGVRSQHEDGEGAPGTDPGAPVLARMGLEAALDHDDFGRDFRHRDVGVLSGLSESRTAVTADGYAVLI